MKTETCEGIILRSMQYKERQRIAVVFTPLFGLISLIVKGISANKAQLLSLTTPLCQAEFHFSRGKTDLFQFLDGSIIDEHLYLRNEWKHLETATQILKALLLSQFPGKTSIELYTLTITYLKQIPLFEDLNSLMASFYLKLLFHEGLLSIQKECNLCREMSYYLYHGESLCKKHATHPALFFTEEQWKILDILQNTRSFATLKSLSLDKEFFNQISSYFFERIATL